MTVLIEQPVTGRPAEPPGGPARLGAAPPPPAPAGPAPAAPGPDRSQARLLGAAWVLALIFGIALVIYGFGPLFQARAQRGLVRDETAAIDRAANEASGLDGVTVPTKAPEMGSPAGIIEIGDVQLQQVVVEGVSSSETRAGPGHVPGTAGLGQPGNSVVVGRARAFGGPFRSIAKLDKGDKILVTTTQGQSVYEVLSARRMTLAAGTADTGDQFAATDPAPAAESSRSTVDELYGPSDDDRLTLVTSSGPAPWNDSRAVVVVATLEGQAFAPTPQNGRSAAQTGLGGDEGAVATVVLVMALYGATLAASVVLYRRFRPGTAYLLTIGPVLATTIMAGETLSRLLPAWT